jgi:hypothetical protein
MHPNSKMLPIALFVKDQAPTSLLLVSMPGAAENQWGVPQGRRFHLFGGPLAALGVTLLMVAK